jgi:UDP:flavonoid glycosyltransferase YjiC (YdhE family)
VHEPFRKLRKKYKLTTRNTYLEEMEGDQNLICDLAELFSQREDAPDNYTVLSPLIYSDDTSSCWLLKQLAPSKKTIFVSMGSTGSWEAVQFLNNPQFAKYNIIAASDKDGILNAPHIIRTGFVNVHDVYPHTDLVICHGGNGTIYQSLLYGIPLLFKTAHFEQEWNMYAIEHIGAGKSLDNVSGVDNYGPFIAEWVTLKNTGLYTDLSEKIKESVQSIEQKLQEIVYKIELSETIPA